MKKPLTPCWRYLNKVTLYRIESVLYWAYTEADKNAQTAANKPSFNLCLAGGVPYAELDAYWIQYLCELEDFFNTLRSADKPPTEFVKLTKPQLLLIKELRHIIEGGVVSNVVEAGGLCYIIDFIYYLIISKLAQKQINSRVLPRPAWDRHSILTEIVNTINNIYVYKHKLFTNDLKRKWFMCILTILEALVDMNIIQREMIEQTSYSYGEASSLGRPPEELHADFFKKNNGKKKPKAYKTVYLYSLKKVCSVAFSTWNWNVSLVPLQPIIFKEQLIYLRAVTFNSVNKTTLENKYSDKHFWLEDLTILDKLQQLCIYINNDLYARVFDEVSKSVSKLSLDAILDDLNLEIKKLSKPLYILKKYSTNLGVGGAGERVDWKNTRERNKTIQKTISKYLMLLDFLYLETQLYLFDRPLYFTTTFDFRGRIYLKSKISPQTSHLFRYIYDYGPQTTLKNLGEGALPINYSKLFFYLKTHIEQLPELDDNNQRLFVWLFIELAKLVKSKYITRYDGRLTIEQFVELGVKIYTNSIETPLDLEKRIQKTYIMHIINEILTNRHLKRDYIIYKDATASAIQLLTLLLRPAKPEIKLYANLNSNDSWYDTYYYIIKMFLHENEIDAASRPFFTREYLKKTIMTYNYAATLYTCWNDFKAAVKEEDLKANTDFLKTLRVDFENFYNFLNRLFNEQTLFLKSIDQQANLWLANCAITREVMLKSNDSSRIYLHYFMPRAQRLTVKLNAVRKTLQISGLTANLDLKKTRQAIKPNTTHALDATLVRETLRDLNQPIITIHDCFGINAYKIDALLLSINKNIGRLHLYNNETIRHDNDLCFSIFIVL